MCIGKTHVRVCLSTKDLLDQLVEDTERAEGLGHIKRWWEGETLTTAEMVDQLVKREIAHRKRSSRQRRSRGRAAKALSSITPLTPPSKEDLMEGIYDLAGLSDDWGAANRGE